MDTGSIDKAAAETVQILTTTHFALQTARSSTVFESTGRATVFLTTVSTSLIALGFIAVRRLRPANGMSAPMVPVMKTWIPYGVALGLGTVVALALELAGRFPGTTM